VPWTGVGLGNFRAFFPSFRAESVSQHVILHPDNSWLHLVTEIGVPGVIFCLSAVAALLWLRFPPGGVHQRGLRLAGWLSGAMFVAHAAVDEPGHSFAALCIGIICFSLAAPGDDEVREAGAGKWVRAVARFVPAIVIIACVIQRFCVHAGFVRDAAWADARHEQVERVNLAGRSREAAALAAEGLRVAPLHWKLLFQSAVAQARVDAESQVARTQFQLVRRIEPNLISIRWFEGLLWGNLAKWPNALAVWREIFSTKGDWDHMVHMGMPGKTPREYFRDMWAETPSRYRPELAQIARSSPDLHILYLEKTKSGDFVAELQGILADDPDLTAWNDGCKSALFSFWASRGDMAALRRAIAAKPSWARAGWRWVAAQAAEERDFKRAVQMVLTHVPVPDLAPTMKTGRLEEARAAFYQSPDDLKAAMLYFLSLASAGQAEEAVSIGWIITKMSGVPAYFPRIMVAQLARLGDHEAAWKFASKHLL